ncbi:MAG: metallophosphoesterase [Candidatus Aminicenantes bacterium]|nr:metallophosphoesterase [Candidatus Aminicenantes bacterium]
MAGRRDFLRLGLISLMGMGLSPEKFIAKMSSSWDGPDAQEKQKILSALLSDDFPFPYDDRYFECAERIYNVRQVVGSKKWKANLNLILKPGKSLDLKILVSNSLEGLEQSQNTLNLSGVKEVVDIELEGDEARRAYYQVLYREGKESWKALAPKSFKLPFVNFEKGESLSVIFIGDDHTFDDADEVPASLSGLKLSGDYVNEFIKNLKKNANWRPQNELRALKNGLYLALAFRYILFNEDPDMMFLMGDTTGIGSNYRWAALGLPTKNLKDSDYNAIAQIMWLRMRKIYSALSPSLPIYVVLGNHDGEEQWNAASSWATYWRRKYFALPEAMTYPEGGHPEGKYYAFSWGADKNNRGGVLFIVLNTTAFTGPAYPTRLDQWTLGQEQRLWFEKTIDQAEKDWIFLCAHHVLGGWPAGPEETERHIAYGRGPLFTLEDYKEYGDPNKIEQVWITKKALENGARAFIYAHDHIFFTRKLGLGLNGLDMNGLCVGSTKYEGEKGWWNGPLWQKHYGSYKRVPPDFWGPSGITRATIKAKEAKFDYLLTGWTAYSNIPENVYPVTILRSFLLSSPPPKLSFTPSSLSFRWVEDGPSPEEKVITIKNEGSGQLYFKLKTNSPWLKINPLEGESWGKEKAIKVGINTTSLEEGRYQGSIEIESPQVAQAYGKITVDLIVEPPPLYPPIGLHAVKRFKTVAGRVEFFIVLTWKDNFLNKKVKGYRVYMREPEGHWVFLVELPKQQKGFIIDKSAFDTPWVFGVSTVDQKNRESEKAIVILK